MKHIEDKLQQGKGLLNAELKKSIFDWIAAIIIIATIAASLDVFGLLDIKSINFAEFIIAWIPYFLSAMLLNLDLYKKGVFVGKGTKKFIDVADTYSELANSLTGKQVKDLQPFCDKYNEDAVIAIQTTLLRKEGISYEMFDVGYKLDKQEIPALKTLTKRQLRELKFNKLQIKVILKAKKVKVRGINVNILLSSMNLKDPTNIGYGEHELTNKRMLTSTTKYLASTLLMSLIAVKDISTWGWTGLILVIFKVVYMFAGCCMSYFKAYDDITINVANQLMRKTDILKMYLNYIPPKVEEEIVVEQ